MKSLALGYWLTYCLLWKQPPQQSPLPRHQPNPTHDPRFTTVHQTNQTLTALASARRFASGYMQVESIFAGPMPVFQDSYLRPRSRPASTLYLMTRILETIRTMTHNSSISRETGTPRSPHTVRGPFKHQRRCLLRLLRATRTPERARGMRVVTAVKHLAGQVHSRWVQRQAITA